MRGFNMQTSIGLTVSIPMLYFSSCHQGVGIVFGSQLTSGSKIDSCGILNGNVDTRAPVSGCKCVLSYIKPNM